ncbi:MAG: TatD family hydrolase [Saprospiraceae bacterium]|nr:MAG: TatD family hydrolase [Saprospiraceae bacterium]
MRLVDTHTHLYAKAFNNDREAMIQRALDQNVEQFFLPNIDSESIEGMLELEAAYPDRCFAMMGLHPCSVKENFEEELTIMRQWLDRRKFCAVGEIGIDLYWDKTFFEQQKTAFLTQIEWAMELDIPIVIHSRNSTEVIIDLLKGVQDDRLRGIFHCFGGTEAEANAIIDLGFLLGIGGVLTYKNSGLDQALKDIDLKNIVLETDSPYLAPVPFRGKRNESAYVRTVAEKLAEVKGIELEAVAKITTQNAKRIFAGILLPN